MNAKLLTRRQIMEQGRERYREKFKTDQKGQKVLRYLKTMSKYGLVQEIPQRKGKASLWKKSDFSEFGLVDKYNFNIMFRRNYKRLQEISDKQPNWIEKRGIVIYGLAHPDFDKESMDKVNKLIDKFHGIVYELSDVQRDVFKKKIIDMSNKAIKELGFLSPFERFIGMQFTWDLLHNYHEAFSNTQDGSFNYELFKKDTFPFRIEFPDNEKFIFSFIDKNRFLSKYYNTKEKILKLEVKLKSNDYKLSKELSDELKKLYGEMHKCMSHNSLFTVVGDIGQDRNIVDIDIST